MNSRKNREIGCNALKEKERSLNSLKNREIDCTKRKKIFEITEISCNWP